MDKNIKFCGVHNGPTEISITVCGDEPAEMEIVVNNDDVITLCDDLLSDWDCLSPAERMTFRMVLSAHKEKFLDALY